MRGFWMAILTVRLIVEIKGQADLDYAYFLERGDDITSGATGQYTPVSCAMKCLGLDCCETFLWNYRSQHCILLPTGILSTAATDSAHWKSYSMGCELGWLEFDHHCYLLVRDKMSWTDAKLTCEASCAYLTEATDIEENDWLVKTFINDDYCPASNCQMWYGGNDLESEGQFKWSNSHVTMNFTNWKPDQPSLLYPKRGEERDCMSVYKTGLWNDSPCANLRSFICEKP